jgi:sugar/nucleoside kinase (ribokinase family)
MEDHVNFERQRAAHCEVLLVPDYSVQVDILPSPDLSARKDLLAELTQFPPPKLKWKVGGSTNFMITAARLGLTVWSCGHVADDEFGEYLLDVLQVHQDAFAPNTCSGCL